MKPYQLFSEVEDGIEIEMDSTTPVWKGKNMPFAANINEVRGRTVRAARIMAGLDQRQVTFRGCLLIGWYKS